MLGRTIMATSLVLWKLKTSWAFNLHQNLTNILVKLDRKHDLDLWDENNSGKDPNRF